MWLNIKAKNLTENNFHAIISLKTFFGVMVMKRLTLLLILVLVCGVFVLGTINGYTPYINKYVVKYDQIKGNFVDDSSLEPPYYFLNALDDYNGPNAKRLEEAIENGSFVEGYSFATQENAENLMLHGGNYARIYLSEDYLDGNKKDPFHLNVEGDKIVWDRSLYDKPDLEEPAKIKVVYTPKMSENVKAYVQSLEAYAQKIRESGEVLLDGQTFGAVLIPDKTYELLHRDLIERLGLTLKEGILENDTSKSYALVIDENKLNNVLTLEARSPSGYNLDEGENFNKIEISKIIGKDKIFDTYINYLAKLYDSIKENNPKLLNKIEKNANYVGYKRFGNNSIFTLSENAGSEEERKAIKILAYAFNAKEVCKEVESGKRKGEDAIIYNFAHNFINAEGFGLNNQLHGAKLNFDLLKENVKDYKTTGKMKTTMIKYGEFTFMFEPNRIAIVCSADRFADTVVFDKTYDPNMVNSLLNFRKDSKLYKAGEQMVKDKDWIEKFYNSLSDKETRKQFEVYCFKQEDARTNAPPEQGLSTSNGLPSTYSPLIKSAVGEWGGMHMLVMKWVEPKTGKTHIHLISTYRVESAGDETSSGLDPWPGDPLVPFERELVIPKGWDVEDIVVNVGDPNDNNPNTITLQPFIKLHNTINDEDRFIFYQIKLNIEGNREKEEIYILNE